MGQGFFTVPFSHAVIVKPGLACLVASIDSFLAYVVALGRSSCQGFFLCQVICSNHRMVFDHPDQVLCCSDSLLTLADQFDFLEHLSSDS